MGTIYLAGAIDKVTKEGAATWREEAGAILAGEMNHVVCDPFRVWVTQPGSKGNHLPKEQAVIFKGDVAMVRAVDALLVYCDKEIPTCGTYVEVGMAYEHNKIIAVYTPGRMPGFMVGLISSCDALRQNLRGFNDLREACNWLNSVIRQKEEEEL